MTQFDIDQLADFKNQNAISKAETSQEIWEIKTNRELRDSAAGNDVGLRKNQIT